jgi:hypothetical protein
LDSFQRDDVEEYLSTHPGVSREMPGPLPPPAPADDPDDPLDAAAHDMFSIGEKLIRNNVRKDRDRSAGQPADVERG